MRRGQRQVALQAGDEREGRGAGGVDCNCRGCLRCLPLLLVLLLPLALPLAGGLCFNRALPLLLLLLLVLLALAAAPATDDGADLFCFCFGICGYIYIRTEMQANTYVYMNVCHKRTWRGLLQYINYINHKQIDMNVYA
jgi:hypothetical protein